jgi:hypothetical protein
LDRINHCADSQYHNVDKQQSSHWLNYIPFCNSTMLTNNRAVIGLITSLFVIRTRLNFAALFMIWFTL